MTVPPGSTIGIIGGGQLGRMLAVAAAQLGYRCHIYAPEADSPAAEVAAAHSIAAYDDAAALARFAASVDVVTYEFENLPVAAIEAVGERVPLFPNARALATAQDRFAEKSFVARLGAATAPWRHVVAEADLPAAIAEVGAPAILKTCRFGYDGKGQARIVDASEAATAWRAIGGQRAILEGFVDFSHEFSIVACRGRDGAFVSWDPPENVHADGILATSTVPAAPEIAVHFASARALARRVAAELDYVGTFAIEFFATPHGALFNEMAPRVHNSGHWTIEGAVTSQFENHVRAVCGLPLGSTALAAPRVAMRNLIGADADGWADILADPAAHLHLYGKAEARPGRKMGHVTRLG